MLPKQRILCLLMTILLVIKSTEQSGSVARDTAKDSPVDVIYQGCGDTKLCYGVPRNCTERGNCRAIVAISVTEDIYTFEIQGTDNPKYVAFGLSMDTKMGDDSSMECVRNDDDTVSLFTSWTYAIVEPYVSRSDSPQDIVQMISSSIIDGKLYCKFERDEVSTVKGVIFDLARDQYNLMLVAGSRMLDADRVGYHNKIYEVTAASMTLSSSVSV